MSLTDPTDRESPRRQPDHWDDGPEPETCDVCDSPLLLRPGRDAVCVACEDRDSAIPLVEYVSSETAYGRTVPASFAIKVF